MRHANPPSLSPLPECTSSQVRTTFWNWAAPIFGVIYLISPLDIIPGMQRRARHQLEFMCFMPVLWLHLPPHCWYPSTLHQF